MASELLQPPEPNTRSPRSKSTGNQINPAKRRAYFNARRLGMNKTQAAKEARISRPTAYALEDQYLAEGTPVGANPYGYNRDDLDLPAPQTHDSLTGEASDALSDFALFRRRYLGRATSPWQVEAANQMVDFLESPEKEYVVVNAPPGSGKSTLFSHDLPVWLICRNRSIRVMIGSRTFNQAKMYTGRIRRTLERRDPYLPSTDAIARGLACEATAVLCEDYGRFRPINRDLWRLEEFVCAQVGDVLLEDKEATVAAYGFDGGYLGGRRDLVIWDDLVDRKNLRTYESREKLIQDYEDQAETRLEPGGLLILQGQRMGADDLYRWALDQTAITWDDDSDEESQPSTELPRKYHHILFPAHFESLCKAEHKRTSPPYPAGCLLDPKRLPWRELATISQNRGDKYRVLYQQEDVDPADVLIPKHWIDGGRGADGVEYPGCWDKDRGLLELPLGLAAPTYSVVTADPSPTKFWALQHWLYSPTSELRHLVNILRCSMTAGDFLDWNHAQSAFTGIMEEWWQASKDLGHPIRYWIVEKNAAQRFLLQYDHVRRWTQLRGVSIIPHETGANKLDKNFGIDILQSNYQYGRVRLPASSRNQSRAYVMGLVSELTRYPQSSTDDQVMANWFFEHHLPRLFPSHNTIPRAKRPSWLRSVPTHASLISRSA